MLINKKFISKAIIILLIILIIFILLNMKKGGNVEYEKEELIGYVSEGDELIVGDEIDNNFISLYEYEKVMPYFADFADSILFKDYLNDYIISSGTNIREWWVKDLEFDEEALKITFNIVTRDSSERYYVSKDNEGTYIERTILKDEK